MDRYFKANAALSKFCKNYMELKKGLPIRPSEMGVLNIIAETEGPHTPAVIAEMLGVSKPMITAHIASLESKGYITKDPSVQDKRAYYILPTEKATDLVQKIQADTAGHLDRMIGHMGQNNFDTLVRLIDEANCVIEKKEK